MALGQSWSVDLRAGSVEELLDLIVREGSIPEDVKGAIASALHSLPVREDLGVMVNTSGRLENWDEYNAIVSGIPAGDPLPPKPSGFVNIWVGTTNSVPAKIVG